jgi:hypothetical protein
VLGSNGKSDHCAAFKPLEHIGKEGKPHDHPVNQKSLKACGLGNLVLCPVSLQLTIAKKDDQQTTHDVDRPHGPLIRFETREWNWGRYKFSRIYPLLVSSLFWCAAVAI